MVLSSKLCNHPSEAPPPPLVPVRAVPLALITIRSDVVELWAAAEDTDGTQANIAIDVQARFIGAALIAARAAFLLLQRSRPGFVASPNGWSDRLGPLDLHGQRGATTRCRDIALRPAMRFRNS